MREIINNIIFTMPDLAEINKINLLTDKLLAKKYKKIIFYALGSSYAIINFNISFYKILAKNFEIELISSFDSYVNQYFINEINKDSLIIFCSRSGETYEINYQLSLILHNKFISTSKTQNIIIFTNIRNNSLRNIAQKFNLEIISIISGICARFEPFNAIYFLITKLINQSIDLLELKNEIKKNLEIDYSYKWNFNTNIYKEFFKGNDQIIVVFNNNFLLNGLVEWFKHLWYESFGKLNFNIKFENYSSLFHSAIEYYAHHKDLKYFLFFFNFKYSQAQSDLNPLIELLKPIKITNFTVNSLAEILIEIIHYLSLLANDLKIDIFAQPQVDTYKNSLSTKNQEMLELLLG